MSATRLAKLLMAASLGLFAFIVTVNNLADYQSNYAFVQHVLAMDTTFPGNALTHRAITSPPLWTLGYDAIIATEGATSALFAVAALALAHALRADAAAFEHAERFTVAGVTLAFLLWFTSFMVAGGEWFAMWQSKIWNGQEAAFRFYLTALAVLIFVNQPEAG